MLQNRIVIVMVNVNDLAYLFINFKTVVSGKR